MINEAQFQFWIKNNFNVLLRGKHGVGKTAQILEAFSKAGLRYLYFSAATMDAFVDFVGVPKERIDENGNSYLDLVRPKCFQNDEVDAIYMDEFNRANKKIRNSVMELIQFKSINGKKFNNLKIVWAAINPDDDEQEKYDVEALDPAQLDRFHVIVDVPYLPHASYFRSKYGKQIADSALTWWKELDVKQKNLVSPRRLDYALEMHSKNGDMKYVLPTQVNINKLLLELASGSISDKMKNFVKNDDKDGAKKFINIENNYDACKHYFSKTSDCRNFFLPLLSDERLISLISKEKSIEKFIFDNYDKYQGIIQSIANAKSSPLAKRAIQLLKNKKEITNILGKHSILISSSLLKSSYPIISDNELNDILPYQFMNSKFALISKKSINSCSYYRLKNYIFYNKYIPRQLDEQTAALALKDLVVIALRSNSRYIMKNMPNLIKMLNYTLKWFVDNQKLAPISQNVLKRLSQKLCPDFLIEAM